MNTLATIIGTIIIACYLISLEARLRGLQDDTDEHNYKLGRLRHKIDNLKPKDTGSASDTEEEEKKA